MAKQSPNQPPIKVKELIERILESAEIRRQEHMDLTTAVLADKYINEEQRREINRIFDQIQAGRITILDE
ncbi:hypothetical protein [[Phormidium] sp. ETS-05]|uniref:hypothetical protein n=1 Tax=[Phormidium] sp. ETS-05 TaxID=222819 RepID=UPI0018EF00E7|nr:hypothetical protein [[Phormidium] sp. ETS-05]